MTGVQTCALPISHRLARVKTGDQPNGIPPQSPTKANMNSSASPSEVRPPRRSDTIDSARSDKSDSTKSGGNYSHTNGVNGIAKPSTKPPQFQPQPGYKQWVAQAGTLIADLLTCAGADHVITMDLHDPQYQGFFDIPVDNLYGRHLLRKYVQYSTPNYQQAVIVSPDAGGAKRATAIADALGMPFALIHKVCGQVLTRLRAEC